MVLDHLLSSRGKYQEKSFISAQKRSDKDSQTPAEDRIFFPPYKFPFWGLPYGIYSNGGFFNPGLFPFVPGGPAFPPYDGIFGGPFGPGEFPGGGPNPFQGSKPNKTIPNFYASPAMPLPPLSPMAQPYSEALKKASNNNNKRNRIIRSTEEEGEEMAATEQKQPTVLVMGGNGGSQPGTYGMYGPSYSYQGQDVYVIKPPHAAAYGSQAFGYNPPAMGYGAPTAMGYGAPPMSYGAPPMAYGAPMGYGMPYQMPMYGYNPPAPYMPPGGGYKMGPPNGNGKGNGDSGNGGDSGSKSKKKKKKKGKKKIKKIYKYIRAPCECETDCDECDCDDDKNEPEYTTTPYTTTTTTTSTTTTTPAPTTPKYQPPPPAPKYQTGQKYQSNRQPGRPAPQQQEQGYPPQSPEEFYDDTPATESTTYIHVADATNENPQYSENPYVPRQRYNKNMQKRSPQRPYPQVTRPYRIPQQPRYQNPRYPPRTPHYQRPVSLTHPKMPGPPQLPAYPSGYSVPRPPPGGFAGARGANAQQLPKGVVMPSIQAAPDINNLAGNLPDLLSQLSSIPSIPEMPQGPDIPSSLFPQNHQQQQHQSPFVLQDVQVADQYGVSFLEGIPQGLTGPDAHSALQKLPKLQSQMERLQYQQNEQKPPAPSPPIDMPPSYDHAGQQHIEPGPGPLDQGYLGGGAQVPYSPMPQYPTEVEVRPNQGSQAYQQSPTYEQQPHPEAPQYAPQQPPAYVQPSPPLNMETNVGENQNYAQAPSYPSVYDHPSQPSPPQQVSADGASLPDLTDGGPSSHGSPQAGPPQDEAYNQQPVYSQQFATAYSHNSQVESAGMQTGPYQEPQDGYNNNQEYAMPPSSNVPDYAAPANFNEYRPVGSGTLQDIYAAVDNGRSFSKRNLAISDNLPSLGANAAPSEKEEDSSLLTTFNLDDEKPSNLTYRIGVYSSSNGGPSTSYAVVGPRKIMVYASTSKKNGSVSDTTNNNGDKQADPFNISTLPGVPVDGPGNLVGMFSGAPKSGSVALGFVEPVDNDDEYIDVDTKPSRADM